MPVPDFYSKENQINARRKGQYPAVMASLNSCPFCDLKSKYIIKRLSGVCLTANLFPYIDGHLLIVTQRHIEDIGDLSKSEWKAIFELVKSARRLYKKTLAITDFALVYQQGHQSGQSLGHFHISLVPNAKKVLDKNYQKITISPLELAEKLKAKS